MSDIKEKLKDEKDENETEVTEEKTEEQAEKTGPVDAEVVDEPAEDAETKQDDEVAKLKEQLMRNMAEYDNYRKRTAKEKAELMPDITARVVSDFLPVLDNLERALAADCSDEGYKKGVQMIYDSFM